MRGAVLEEIDANSASSAEKKKKTQGRAASKPGWAEALVLMAIREKLKTT